VTRHPASDKQCLPSTHSRQNKHSTDADGDRGRSTLARERHAVCRIARPTSKETKTDRHNVFICLFIKLTRYFRYAARQFAIRILTGTYDISFIVYRFTSLACLYTCLCDRFCISPPSCSRPARRRWMLHKTTSWEDLSSFRWFTAAMIVIDSCNR